MFEANDKCLIRQLEIREFGIFANVEQTISNFKTHTMLIL